MANQVQVQGSLPPPLSAQDQNSFAYPSMKDRVPVILSKIVDSLTRNRDKISQDFEGKDVIFEEIKAVIGAISQLRYEVMTNKPAAPLRDSQPDTLAWNRELQRLQQREHDSVLWFCSPWLWVECYLYRRVHEAVSMCANLKTLDVFEEQKRAAFANSFLPISQLTLYLMDVQEKVKADVDENQLAFYFTEFLQICLWGNKCDLSISGGSANNQVGDPLEQLEQLKPNILVDDTSAIFQVLLDAKKKHPNVQVDIVMDNAGFELITDLCLAELLVSSGLASVVHFHLKAMPWFVSDVTSQDFHWTLTMMSAMNHLAISHFAQQWKTRLSNGSWILHIDDYWTMPNDFSEMKKLCPALYSTLSKSDLVIFKGDLNYRKLDGDLKWDHATDFATSLRGFRPAPLCSLRTLKSESVVGLRPGQDVEVAKLDDHWSTTGDYAVISFAPTVASSR